MRHIQNLWSHLKERKKITGKAGSFLGWEHMLIDVPHRRLPEFSGSISTPLTKCVVLLQKDSSTLQSTCFYKHLWLKKDGNQLVEFLSLFQPQRLWWQTSSLVSQTRPLLSGAFRWAPPMTDGFPRLKWFSSGGSNASWHVNDGRRHKFLVFTHTGTHTDGPRDLQTRSG